MVLEVLAGSENALAGQLGTDRTKNCETHPKQFARNIVIATLFIVFFFFLKVPLFTAAMIFFFFKTENFLLLFNNGHMFVFLPLITGFISGLC